MNLACSGAGILAINPAAVWCQTSTNAGASDGELHKTIQPLSLKGNISRPLNMDALVFDGDMWDPEYCDSEHRAVEASGESRDELCPCQQTQLKLNRKLTVHVWPVPGSGPATPWTRNAVGISVLPRPFLQGATPCPFWWRPAFF